MPTDQAETYRDSHQPAAGTTPYWTPAPPALRPRPWRRGRLVVGSIVLALVAGATGGFVTHVLETTTSTVTVQVEPAERLAGTALDVATVAARIEPSLVTLSVTTPDDELAGSGIIVSSDGAVLTNAHMVEDAETVTVARSGTQQQLPATVVDLDRTADIALLRITGAHSLPVAPLAATADLRVGDDVVAIGNALDLGSTPSVTRGIVSGLDRAVPGTTLTGMIQTDAPISSGSSGGALVNAAGQVVGIPAAMASSTLSTTAQDVGFAIPIETALRVLRSFGVQPES